MMSVTLTVSVILALITRCNCNVGYISDSILYSIDWIAADQPLVQDDFSDRSVLMRTKENEQYQCLVPDSSTLNQQGESAAYTGPDEMELLAPLFAQTACSYRMEIFWNYELCHGKHIRQYHEEKHNGKKSSPDVTEYFLGFNYQPPPVPPVESPPVEDGSHKTHTSPPTRKVEGVEIAFYEIQFTRGTVCEVTGEHRVARIQYVCSPQGRGEIYQLKEVASCEYEVIVLTSKLCTHPMYQMKKDPINAIQCQAVDGSPHKPISLEMLESDQKRSHSTSKQEFVVIDDVIESTPTVPTATVKTYQQHIPTPERPESQITDKTDQQTLADFLNGYNCITGGQGWWKHEFCYGKHVTQYHKDSKTKRKEIITLGKWNENMHKNWIAENPSKKPNTSKDKKFVSHYYSNGDICDLTKKERGVEVKLKCKPNEKHPHSITISLQEPYTCQYVLTVESQLFCSVLNTADSYGVLQHTMP